MTATITALYRYPVKGFSPEPVAAAELDTGGTFPFDRAYAIENGPSGFDPAAPAYLPKNRFLMLMRDERMASFTTRFDETTGTFRVARAGLLLVEARLTTPQGRAKLEAWLAEAFRGELRGAPRVLSAPGHSFSDLDDKVVHLVNMESVRALEAELGRPVDPLRFRPNIIVDGPPAWSELNWAGNAALPDVTLAMRTATTRCAATNVDPRTGARDMQLPNALMVRHGHMDFGVYLTVAKGGRVAVGDTFAPLPAGKMRKR